MQRKKIGLLFFVLFSIITLSGQFVQAQTSTGIRVTPVLNEELVAPGQTISRVLKVANESNEGRKLFIYIRDFKGEGEDGLAKLIVPGTEKGYFLASWINVASTSIEFAPFEEKEIYYDIKVPVEIGPGGYYGALVVASEPPKLNVTSEDKGAGMAISQQTASLILLKVKGDIQESADIREFYTDKTYYNTPFDLKFSSRIENKSNVHIKPNGNIKITNFFNQEVASIPFNEKGSNILPSSTRKFENTWQGKMGFGKYKASLGLSYGTSAADGGQGMQSMFYDTYFWIFPWKLIIIIVSSFIFLASLAWLLLKLYKNKAIKKAMEDAGLGQMKYVKQFEGPSPTMHVGLIIFAVLLTLFVILGFVFFLFFA